MFVGVDKMGVCQLANFAKVSKEVLPSKTGSAV